MHRWQTIAVAAAAVVGAAGLGVAVRAAGSADQQLELVATRAGAIGSGDYTFTVRATPVPELYPGAVRQLRLTLTNPFGFDLRVTGVRADLTSTSDPGCAPIPANLQVRPYTDDLPVRVAARDSEQAGAVPLHMPNSVANACQGATFSIAVHADATRDGQ